MSANGVSDSDYEQFNKFVNFANESSLSIPDRQNYDPNEKGRILDIVKRLIGKATFQGKYELIEQAASSCFFSQPQLNQLNCTPHGIARSFNNYLILEPIIALLEISCSNDFNNQEKNKLFQLILSFVTRKNWESDNSLERLHQVVRSSNIFTAAQVKQLTAPIDDKVDLPKKPLTFDELVADLGKIALEKRILTANEKNWRFQQAKCYVDRRYDDDSKLLFEAATNSGIFTPKQIKQLEKPTVYSNSDSSDNEDQNVFYSSDEEDF